MMEETDYTIPVSTGTTILACAYRSGVVLAADSRTSTGAYVANRASDKITQICDNVWMCRSGSAADTQNVAAYVKRMVEEHAMERNGTVAKLTQKIAYENKEKLQAGMIIAGWDRVRGPQVYGIPLGGSMLEAPFSVSGSGSAYIYGYLDNTYKENMEREECEKWMTEAISLAIARDASSGGVIRLVTIHENGCEKQCVLPKDHKVCDGELEQVATTTTAMV
ncbi:unnamed protein product [Bathycoccus prasinos]